jgi:formylglycine-generating enzyme required for sulfatase activity
MAPGEQNSTSITSSVGPTQFRIFLASPGDVPLERKLTREVITHVGGERRFRGNISIEVIAWDQPGAAVAMEAAVTPQQAISKGLPKPEECDLAVVVMWSRIGTPLPSGFALKEDGSPYLSGTEWEYFNALKGYRSNGKPVVWVYRRKGAPQFKADDPELDEKHGQWKKLEGFFSAFTNPDGSLAGGVNTYESPDDFRRLFEQHLRDHLEIFLESQPSAPASEATVPPRWSSSPYPGLQAFTPEQAPIFFGRGKEIDQLLQQFSDPTVRFVAVVGVSGSGKSSLVMAGLLPRLRSGVIGNALWTDIILRPGTRGGNPFLALAFTIKELLGITGQTEQELANAMRADADVALEQLNRLLVGQESASELLLVVDQFEELFTQCNDNSRTAFIALLEKIVARPHLRVIVTMRADFYAPAIQEPVLAELLRRDRSTFPLDPPAIGALHEMIIHPAEAAGIELEEGLAQRLLDDAGEGPGAMAVIAFTLNRLYDRERDSCCLSIQAYEAIGGVKGAIEKRAETALTGLPGDMAAVLPKLFAHLVEVNEQGVATRRRALQSLLQGEIKLAAKALTDARLLVTGKGEEDRPTLEIAHETVLSGWQRMQSWTRDHAEALRARRDLEQVAAEWDNSGRNRSALRSGKLLRHYLGAAEPHSDIATLYLKRCKARRNALRFAYSVMGMLVIAALWIFSHVSQSDYPPRLAAKALFVQFGILRVKQPVMERIPSGHFEMGAVNGDLDERHVHTVHFARDYEIGRYEVTFEEYDLFAAATGRRKASDEGWTYATDKRRGRLPVINVSWEDAVAYAQWLSARSGLQEPHHYRLPSESEWEYAARAETATLRFWPESATGEPDRACKFANVLDAKNETMVKSRYKLPWEAFHCEDDYPFTAPVGSFIANQWKLHDMLGNVWEWTQDCYTESYEDTPDNGLPYEQDIEGSCQKRVLRGGSWNNPPQHLRSSNRGSREPFYRNHTIGFRLARTP